LTTDNTELELLVEFDGLEYIILSGYDLENDKELTDEEMDSIEQDIIAQKWNDL
jgi:hypothetical protein